MFQQRDLLPAPTNRRTLLHFGECSRWDDAARTDHKLSEITWLHPVRHVLSKRIGLCIIQISWPIFLSIFWPDNGKISSIVAIEAKHANVHEKIRNPECAKRFLPAAEGLSRPAAGVRSQSLLSTDQPVFYTQHVSQSDYESLLSMKAGPEKKRFEEADWHARRFHQSRTVTLAMVLLTCDQHNVLTHRSSEMYLGACVQI